ncbi:PTS glucose transporter subunit IIABC [Aerococcus christensenii]|uniref:PTS glucose transporter subunit IIABC n=1 Tax=Aerococcus christensenii TaxID=87541 RepID=A0A120I8N0_9LACT|nr:PTS glucose transporter subunit IIA [Aerococcus christensenii]AMB92288.1 hypothetical protein AWM71_02665 [Aerococcus christensenii]PKY91984.1 PTS glucose transporter subunit IIABC [Aerococcus christensenii]WEB70888.1 PTS glucose transporter subunit IIA [Aerococcus christensenii]
MGVSKKRISVRAFVAGEFIPLDQVSDPRFSKKVLGDGFALRPLDGRVKSPLAGEITLVFPTHHMIGMKTKEDLQILLHLGFNTVELGGRPFRSNVKVGDKVEVGDLLSTMDIEAIRSAENVDITCALVFVNGTEKGAILEYEVFGRVKAGDIVCTVTLNEES